MEQKTTRLYQFFRLLVVPLLLYYSVAAYHTLTAAEGETIIYAAWARLTYVFVIAPLFMALGFWVMRRAPGNVIGPALVVYICASPSELIFALKLSAEQAHLNNLMLGLFAIPSLIVMLSHFPDGNVYPKRLRAIVYVLLISPVVMGVLSFDTLLPPPAMEPKKPTGKPKLTPS